MAMTTLRLRCDRQSAVSLIDQIVMTIQEAIAQHVLRPGDKLPSVRSLAREQAISPIPWRRLTSD